MTFTNCFVPDRNKLTHALDFASGANRILEASRLIIGWTAAGVAAGAYEAAISTRRKEFSLADLLPNSS